MSNPHMVMVTIGDRVHISYDEVKVLVFNREFEKAEGVEDTGVAFTFAKDHFKAEKMVDGKAVDSSTFDYKEINQ